LKWPNKACHTAGLERVRDLQAVVLPAIHRSLKIVLNELEYEIIAKRIEVMLEGYVSGEQDGYRRQGDNI
jgi:hypothetical protein